MTTALRTRLDAAMLVIRSLAPVPLVLDRPMASAYSDFLYPYRRAADALDDAVRTALPRDLELAELAVEKLETMLRARLARAERAGR